LNGMLQRAAFCMDKHTSLTSSMMALGNDTGGWIWDCWSDTSCARTDGTYIA